MSLKKIIKLLYKSIISKIFISIYGKVQIQYEEIKDIKTEKADIRKEAREEVGRSFQVTSPSFNRANAHILTNREECL